MISRRRSVGRPSRTSLDALQDAALTLGLDSFTLAAVAKEVGVAEATVYNYVHSRDELYR
ncbi:TetR family transcriptional regulator, partial [Corynebacterium variabile]